MIGIRQHIEQRAEPKGKTLNLFAHDPVIGKYRFSALTTDLDLPAEAVWRTYRGRADCENQIKELKYDFAADATLQAVYQVRLHHHRKPETYPESGLSDATASLDAGLVGCCKNLRFASQIHAHLFALKIL